MANGSLDGVRLKLDRAQKHLNEITGILSLIKQGECRTVFEHDQNLDLLVQRIHIIPKPKPELSVVVGDFLFAVRSALDHLVWQLVIQNGESPTTDNMFPITSDWDKFDTAARVIKGRKRLMGVSATAYALIESLQPYHAGNEPLERLDALHNVDKHRTLNLTTVVADNAALSFTRGGVSVLNMFISDELRDGAIFGDIGIPINDPEFIKEFPTAGKLANVEVKGQASLFVAFDEPDADSLEDFRVELTLSSILKFVKETIIPRFEPLFT
jgi:hypothetical protein